MADTSNFSLETDTTKLTFRDTVFSEIPSSYHVAISTITFIALKKTYPNALPHLSMSPTGTSMAKLSPYNQEQ